MPSLFLRATSSTEGKSATDVRSTLATRRIDAAEKAINDRELSAPKHINYRKRVFAYDDPVCAHWAYGVPDVLNVAHIDGSRENNEISNLVIVCPPKWTRALYPGR